MKTLKLLIVLLLISSCSINENLEENCGCTKTTFYHKDESTQYIEHIDSYIISIEDVECSQPTFKQKTETPYIFYTIKCK